MNKNLFYLLPLLLVALLGSSCSPENVTARRLEGDWDIASFRFDGTEAIGAGISLATMEFEEYDGEEGDFNFVIIYEAGGTETFSGDYSLNADGDELDLTYTDGTIESYDLTLEDDDLEMSGNFDGTRVDIEAERD